MEIPFPACVEAGSRTPRDLFHHEDTQKVSFSLGASKLHAFLDFFCCLYTTDSCQHLGQEGHDAVIQAGMPVAGVCHGGQAFGRALSSAPNKGKPLWEKPLIGCVV